MSRSSDRAAAEPLAALVAVFAVTVGIALYAGILDDAIVGTETERNRAAPTADLIERRLSTAGILDPGGINRSLAAVPGGYSGNVTIRAGQLWSVGPKPSAGSDTVERTVHVRTSPGVVRRGTLRVSVWR